MGNRVKGRVKPKSIKAAKHSGMSSKRKLSRMGKKLKRHNAGLEATFFSRAKAIKRLQITLKDFRRLCILKGIYPREPRGRTPGNKKGQVYYHIKDIRALAHEPLLMKFREFKTFMKKVRKASNRLEKDEARRKEAMKPQYTLNHIVRERYPRFVDALGDLDDALTMTYLFGALPSQGRVKTKITTKAQELAAAWSSYCAVTSSITKTFISVKGVYFEAGIQNTTVRWIVPHAFTQNMPIDVDYRVMVTFFEFYEVLLGFVLFKLYNDIGVRFPLVSYDKMSDEDKHKSLLAAHLHALSRRGGDKDGGVSAAITESVNEEVAKGTEVEEKKSTTNEETKKDKTVKKALEAVDINLALNSLGKDDEMDSDVDEGSDSDEEEEGKSSLAGPLRAALDNMAKEQEATLVAGGNSDIRSSEVSGEQLLSTAKLNDSALKRRRLLAGLTIFFSREVPRGYLELVCLAYGAQVGWDGEDSPISVRDKSITHHIVDRNVLPSSFKSLPGNREFIQPQWIVDCANFHFLLPCSRYAVGKSLPPHLSPFVDNEEEGYKPKYLEEVERLKNGEIVEEDDNEDDDETQNDGGDGVGGEQDKKETPTPSNEDSCELSKENTANTSDCDSVGDISDKKMDSEDEGTEEEEEDVDALEHKKMSREVAAEKEAKELAKLMMSKKGKRLYNRMQHGLSKKEEQIESLRQKREQIESSKEKSKDGKSVNKQKVERLKRERRETERKYSSAGSMDSERQKRGKHRKA